MSRKSLLKPSIAALTMLVAWWGVLLFVDGNLATEMPYERYRTIAMLYPDVFYPGVPGMVLAEILLQVGTEALFGGLTFYVGLFGWVVALSVAIGAGAEKYASGRLSPSAIAAGSVLVLFVGITVIEAVLTLL